jgi:hypothetical protein
VFDRLLPVPSRRLQVSRFHLPIVFLAFRDLFRHKVANTTCVETNVRLTDEPLCRRIAIYGAGRWYSMSQYSNAAEV